jgi:hypothetical protein
MAAQGGDNITIVLDSEGNLVSVSQPGEEWAPYEPSAGDEPILLTPTTLDAVRASAVRCWKDPRTGRIYCSE